VAANDTRAAAQDLSPTMLALGAGPAERGAVLGSLSLNIATLYSADMDTNPGWSLQGQWAYGVPIGAGGDPSSGYTGDNVIGYNLNGAYTNNMPVYYATTPAFSTIGYSGLSFSFQRWLGVEDAYFDSATVQVATMGRTGPRSGTTPGASRTLPGRDRPTPCRPWPTNRASVYLRWVMGPRTAQ